MSYIITDDKHYKNIAKSLRYKLQTDRQFYPSEMSTAINNIPSSAEGSDNLIGGVYLLNPDDDGHPTKIKYVNLTNEFSNVLKSKPLFKHVRKIEYINCKTTNIADACFDGLIELTSIDLPDTLTVIGYSAFQNCSSLVSIKLPESLSTIKYSTFNNCINLTSVNIPAGLNVASNTNFNGCKRLKNVTIGNGFNSANLVLSASTLYTRETIVSWLIALADRTGKTSYELGIGYYNLNKLTEEDKMIAFNKNWMLK